LQFLFFCIRKREDSRRGELAKYANEALVVRVAYDLRGSRDDQLKVERNLNIDFYFIVLKS